MLKNLKAERKEIRKILKPESASAFLKARINSIKLLINNGWGVAIKKLQALRREIRNSDDFTKFRGWKSEYEEIVEEIEEFRGEYINNLLNIREHA